MLKKIGFVIRYWLLWIVFFELARVFFLIINFTDAKSAGVKESFLTLFYGLRMDMSMAAYLIIPVILSVILSLYINVLTSTKIYKVYNGIVLFIMLLIVITDVNIYRAWGTRLDTTPLKYLSNPKEAWASVSYLPVFWIIFFFLLAYLTLLLFFNKVTTRGLQQPLRLKQKILTTFLLLLLAGITIIPLRGGLQLAPINQSSVYFSKNNFANLAAINAPWNFMFYLKDKAGTAGKGFSYLSAERATAIRDSLYKANANNESFTDTTKTPLPNIIVIVWESFTEKATHLQRNGIDITPGFNALKKDGVYFSDIYASGDRTDKGIVAVLSGYPAQPTASIVKVPAKSAKLPMMSTELHKKGYSNYFYYGGEPEFANMKSYLLQGNFNSFITKSNFSKQDQNSKWGAHDGVVSKKILQDLGASKQPFFCNWLTLSSHEPFETPVPAVISGNDNESLFLNSLHYTDAVLYEFIQQAKKQVWWNNTIIAIVADHGHPLPPTGKRIDNYKIPMLFTGGALTKTGVDINKTGAQTDLAATLFGMLNFSASSFSWSKNLTDSSVNLWAYFSFNNGFGFVQPHNYFIFDNVGKLIIEKSGTFSTGDIESGKALLQLSFGDYLNK